MPRLDFEKQMARQLKDRELKPSPGSWEKLQGRVEQEEKKRQPKYWWVGIAASIAGAIIIFNFSVNSPVIEKAPVVVDGQEIPQEKITIEKPNSETVSPGRSMPLPNVTSEPVHKKQVEVASSEPAIKNLPETPISEVEAPAVVVQKVSGATEISDKEINELLEKAMAEVSAEMGGEPEVTNAEIDRLLASARASVRQEQALNATATLSADQLLSEVETELEHSFRAQVFEIIKVGLRKTRNAVANINE